MVKLPRPCSYDADDRELLKQVVAYYHRTLLDRAPEALEYLARRGLKDPEMVERFRDRVCRPDAGVSAAGEEPGGGGRAARALAEARDPPRESGHEHFNGSVVFPIFGEAGDVLGLFTGAKSPPGFARAPLCTSTFRPSPRGVEHLKPLRPRARSSSAKPSSTP